MPYINVKVRVSDKTLNVFKRMRRGTKSFFFDSIMNNIETDDYDLLNKRIKQIIIGEFDIVFGEKEKENEPENVTEKEIVKEKREVKNVTEKEMGKPKNKGGLSKLEELNSITKGF